MTNTKTVASKAFVAVVAAAMVFSLVAPAAKAATAEELQAQITALMAQITALQGGGTPGAVTNGAYNFTRSLTIGSTGADVTALQQYLISKGHTIAAGATGYFGAQTQAAVAAWQTANGITPAAGYFGPVSQAKYMAMMASTPTTPTTPDTDIDTDTDTDTDTTDLSGEASLDMFEVDDMSDDEAEEGETSEVGTFTLEFVDGDAEISRLDIALLAVGDANTNTVQPWRAFETVSLWVDGDMVAEIDASDEDDYLDEDDGSLRFTGLDIVAMEDEELEITVGVTVQNGLDDDELTNWDLYALAVRYFDADGVATTENAQEDLSGNENAGKGPTAVFETVAEGANDDATIESSTSNPDQATLKVEDDTSDSDEFDIFMFEIEVDEDSGTLVLDDMIVDLLVSNPTGGVTATMDDIIEEVTLTINGQTEDGTGATGTLDTQIEHSIAATESNRVPFTFEFDGLELDADDVYEATLTVTFKGTDVDATPDNYSNGVTVQAFVDGSEAQLEGAEGSNVLTGTEQSEAHTLSTVVPVISDETADVTADDPNDSGTISFEFNIEADSDDIVGFDINDVTFTRTSNAVSALTPAGGLTLVGGDATLTAPGVWTIEDGDEATFALDFTYATVDVDDNGTYRVTLDSVLGVDVDLTSGALNLAD